jgi:hypothetical protein
MNERPTLGEVARARPHRGSGIPARCVSHKAAILALLRERGARGVLGSELYSQPERYGRSPRNRISELRKDGYLIEGKPHGFSDWWYRLIRDNAGVKPLSDSLERAHGPRPSDKQKEPADDLPLFASSNGEAVRS